MDYSDLYKSGTGAVIGFALAQLVNIGTIGWRWFTRPRLRIEANGSCTILSHSTAAGNGEYYREKIYGFYVRNRGRRIAANVRFQLLKVECRNRSSSRFRTVSEGTYDLALYSAAHVNDAPTATTLVPRAASLVHLAGWREDWDVIAPAIVLPDYYEETCSDAVEYRFTIVAFDEGGYYAQKVLTISA